jgi:hypothetical protein
MAACDNTAASLVAPKAFGNGIGFVTLLYGILASWNQLISGCYEELGENLLLAK